MTARARAFLALGAVSVALAARPGPARAEPPSPVAGDGGVAAAPAVRPILVRGLVTARGLRTPLAAAALTLDGQPIGETDGNGRFGFETTPGPHVLQVQAPSHEPGMVSFEGPREDSAPDVELLVRLEPRSAGERYETVVSAPAHDAPRITVGAEEARTTAGTLGDPFRVIESLPGVAQVVWPLPLYAVRGANPGNTGFFIDGLRVPAIFHFALGPAVFHPHFLRGLDLHTGGYPARYGRYASGIVAATTAVPPADRVRASADVRLYDAGGLVSAPWDDGVGVVAVAGRFSYTGALLSALSPELTLGYGDAQLMVERPMLGGRTSVFAFGSVDRLARRRAAQADDEADLDFYRVDLRHHRPLGRGRLRVAVAAGWDHARSTLFESPIEVSSTTVSTRAGVVQPVGEHVELEGGLDGEWQSFSPSIPDFFATPSDVARERTVGQAGAYLAAVVRGGPGSDGRERWVLTPSLRIDGFVEGDETLAEPGPRLALRVRPAGDFWLKANVGRYAQMATLPLSVPGFESFDLGGGTQRSWQASVGAESPVGTSLTADVTVFGQRYVGLTDVASTFDRDIRRDGFLVRRPGWGYGTEILLRRPPGGRWDGWLAYTLSWSQREFEGGVLGPSEWDQRHVLNLVSSRRLGRAYRVGGRFHVNSGRPYPTYPGGTVEYVRLPSFWQIDVRADRRFVFDRFVLDAYVELVNATFTCEVLSVQVSGGKRTQESFCLPLPSLGVHAEF